MGGGAASRLWIRSHWRLFLPFFSRLRSLFYSRLDMYSSFCVSADDGAAGKADAACLSLPVPVCVCVGKRGGRSTLDGLGTLSSVNALSFWPPLRFQAVHLCLFLHRCTSTRTQPMKEGRVVRVSELLVVGSALVCTVDLLCNALRPFFRSAVSRAGPHRRSLWSSSLLALLHCSAVGECEEEVTDPRSRGDPTAFSGHRYSLTLTLASDTRGALDRHFDVPALESHLVAKTRKRGSTTRVDVGTALITVVLCIASDARTKGVFSRVSLESVFSYPRGRYAPRMRACARVSVCLSSCRGR